MFFRILISLSLVWLTSYCCAEQKNISLDLQNAQLSESIRLLASFLHFNVIISPQLEGVVTMHLQDASPAQAFDLLLTTHGLAKWPMGKVWYIASRNELIKYKQEELKWQQISEEVAPLVNQIWPLRYAKAQDIQRLLKEDSRSLLSKRGSVHADVRTNRIYIQDIAEHLTRLRSIVQQLDVPVQQIAIEARLVSMDHESEHELGLAFSNKLSPAMDQAGLYRLALAKLADGSLLDVKLSALERAGSAELISSPRLFTANQQSASIEAGEEVPYQEVSESGGTGVTFKKAVLSLQVTPQVLPANKVLLQLKINQDRPNNRMVLGVPTISTRQITTSVLVKNGQTIVLGGIYETNAEKSEQGLPFLGRIPLLGGLFKEQQGRKSKRELLIFVTPHIIS